MSEDAIKPLRWNKCTLVNIVQAIHENVEFCPEEIVASSLLSFSSVPSSGFWLSFWIMLDSIHDTYARVKSDLVCKKGTWRTCPATDALRGSWGSPWQDRAQSQTYCAQRTCCHNLMMAILSLTRCFQAWSCPLPLFSRAFPSNQSILCGHKKHIPLPVIALSFTRYF